MIRSMARALGLSVFALPALAQTGAGADPASDLGVVVMAHGGSDEWNQGVSAAVAPLRNDYSIEVAFGMADAASVQDAVSRLEAAGSKRIAVVRLFISGESWYERTRQILGLEEGAPSRPAESDHEAHENAPDHSMQFWRVDSDSAFAVSVEGLAEAPEMGEVLADRARALSTEPRREDVLILAHGPESDEEDERWLAYIDSHADRVRAALPFHSVAVETLREDWPEKREAAENGIRDFVASASREGRTVLVVPFRVHGFGPYAEILEGYDYVADGRGLVPHENVTTWIERQIVWLMAAGFTTE